MLSHWCYLKMTFLKGLGKANSVPNQCTEFALAGFLWGNFKNICIFSEC